jgi:glycosyltransferase involved in cell wall biosynthesis
MSCHGTGRWLKEALDSLPWSMDGLEVWLTANGHDDAPDVARAETPVLIHKLYRDVTLPLSGSLNVMLARAAGDYVMRLDCDDNLLMDTRLAREIGGWEEIGYEDWHLYAKLARHPHAHAVMLDRPVLLHRVRPNSRYAQMVVDNDAHIAAIREALL